MVPLASAFLTLILLSFVVISVKKGGARHLAIGLLGIFGLGHYVLPVVFRPLSSLQLVRDDDLFLALLISGLYFLVLGIGFLWSGRLVRGSSPADQTNSGLDALLIQRPGATFAVFGTIYFAYLANSVQTIYQAGGVEDYISQQDTFDAAFAMLASFCSSGMALMLAYMAKKRGESARFAVMLGAYLLSLILLLSTAQRSALITPVIALAVAFGLVGHVRAMKFTIIGGLLLLVVASPFLVLMRDSPGLQTSSISLSALVEQSSTGEVPMVFVQSMVDRADVLNNMVNLKRHIDIYGFANAQYFYSILVSYIPGFLNPGKPTVMSVTGSIDGHISVISWQIERRASDIGSLTVFGPMVAYHEGGWLWLMINGFLTGIAINLLYAWLGVGRYWHRILYISIFPMLCVTNVPPSIFQIYTSLSAPFYVFCFLAVLSALLQRNQRSLQKWSTAAPFSPKAPHIRSRPFGDGDNLTPPRIKTD